MHAKRRNKLLALLCISLGVAVAVGLALYALRQNINLFYTPTQVVNHQVPVHQSFRIGGLVVKNSVHKYRKDLNVLFKLTDTHDTVTVRYQGILPDLFREGQGIVADGQLNNQGEFEASQVLAKHDSNYMPPEVKDAIQKAKQYSKRETA